MPTLPVPNARCACNAEPTASDRITTPAEAEIDIIGSECRLIERREIVDNASSRAQLHCGIGVVLSSGDVCVESPVARRKVNVAEESSAGPAPTPPYGPSTAAAC